MLVLTQPLECWHRSKVQIHRPDEISKHAMYECACVDKVFYKPLADYNKINLPWHLTPASSL